MWVGRQLIVWRHEHLVSLSHPHTPSSSLSSSLLSALLQLPLRVLLAPDPEVLEFPLKVSTRPSIITVPTRRSITSMARPWRYQSRCWVNGHRLLLLRVVVNANLCLITALLPSYALLPMQSYSLFPTRDTCVSDYV